MIFYGRNVILEALRSKHSVGVLYVQEGIRQDEKITEILSLAEQRNIPIEFIISKSLNKISKNTEHQGVIADVAFNIDKLEIGNEPNQAYMFISEATYEHNIGAIIRSAEVAGFNGVILPKGVSISPMMARASVGALFHMPIFSASIFNAIKLFKSNGFQVIGIERGGERYTDVNMEADTLFIIGGEDKSLSEQVISKCDAVATIPQSGKVNSLNMSVAASLIMFERMRQENL